MSLRQCVILVETCVVVQCSVDHSIAGRCGITGVLVCRWKETSPLYISREKPYNGFSPLSKRETYMPGSPNWVSFPMWPYP